jgi:hypothetical protein
MVSIVLGLLLSIPAPPCSRPGWVNPAWWTAQREVRRILPKYSDQIDKLNLPAVTWRCGQFQFNNWFFPLYGWTDTNGKRIIVGVVNDNVEDFGTIVHEDMHSICLRLPLNEEEKTSADRYIERVWAVGTK